MWSLVVPLVLVVGCRDDDDDDDDAASSESSSSTGDVTGGGESSTLTGAGPDSDNDVTGDPDGTDPGSSGPTDTGSDVQCGDGDRGQGELCFADPVVLIANRPTAAVVVADFDADGHADVAAGHADGISILLGDGAGQFGAPTPAGETALVAGLAAGSLAGDGLVDLVAARGELGTVVVLVGEGGGAFASQSIALAEGATPRSVAIADVDLDGRNDVIAVDDLLARVHVLRQLSEGTFTPAPAIEVGGSPLSIAIGQLDDENGPDIVLGNFAGASLGVLLHQDAATFEGVDSLAVGQGPRGVVMFDFDGDGRLDLASADGDDDTATVVLGDGSGGAAGALTTYAGAQPRAIVAADFDNDERIDLALAVHDANAASVILGDSEAAGFLPTAAQLVPTLAQPDSLAATDFNEDGLTDLVLASAVVGGGVVVHTSDP